ncbi:MAG: hemolysin family protein [Proteobacteria bacterium]|nr:hemolysin family protein [Pseudomonadota bacterium]
MELALSQDISELIVIIFAVMGAAFFSSAETAITSLGVLKTRHIMANKEQLTQPLRLWLTQPSRVLTTILIFNNLCKVLASVMATDLAFRYFGDQAIGVAIICVTILFLILGEIIPKSFARANSETVAHYAMLIIHVLYRLFYPVVWLLSELAVIVIRKLGSDQTLQATITEEELEFLIEVGEKSGAIEDMKKDMINGVFEFDETKVREIMTPRTDIFALEKTHSIDQAVRMIIQSGHSRLPVYDEQIDNVIGILFAKDLLRHITDPKRNKTLGTSLNLSSLVREPQFVPESKPLMEVFKELKQSKNHMAIIIDEYGGTAGLVTMEDILEEIVGDIQDEFDAEEVAILKIDEDVFDVAGSVNITEFMDFFELDEAFAKDVEGEVDTMAGWMTQLLGHLPEVGQVVKHGELNFEVTEIDRHRIERLRVSRLKPANQGSSETETSP